MAKDLPLMLVLKTFSRLPSGEESPQLEGQGQIALEVGDPEDEEIALSHLL